MRHFSLFDDMDDGFKKKAADDQFFTIDLGSVNALLGLFDVLGWVRRNVRPGDPEGPDPQIIEELLDYANSLYSSEDFVLRVNSGQFEQIRRAFDAFMKYAEQFENQEEFESLNDDIHMKDIWKAEEALMKAKTDPSSNKGLEDIPTMEKNPEDLAEGEIPVNVKETIQDPCPNCGINMVNPLFRECDNCGWNEDKACPRCGNAHSTTIDEFGEKRCDSCGWAEEPEHDVPEGPSQQVAPVTPAAKNQAQTCPICGQNAINPNTNQCTVCEWDGDNACPKCKNDQSLKTDQYGYRSCTNCGWMEEDIQQRAELEEQYKLPPADHPLGPNESSTKTADETIMPEEPASVPQAEDEQETYRSGQYVNYNPDRFGPKMWGVKINPGAGQRPPRSGDLAIIQQKSMQFNEPVPLVLKEQVGTHTWTFDNSTRRRQR